MNLRYYPPEFKPIVREAMAPMITRRNDVAWDLAYSQITKKERRQMLKMYDRAVARDMKLLFKELYAIDKLMAIRFMAEFWAGFTLSPFRKSVRRFLAKARRLYGRN